MAKFMLVCEHEANDCEAISEEFEELGVPAIYRGVEASCSCPFGVHGGWAVVEAQSEEDALASLGPVNKSHTKAYQVEMVQF